MKLPVTLKGNRDAPPNLHQLSQPQPSFEVIRPVEVNNIVTELVNSKHFKSLNAVREIMHKARLKHPADYVLLNHLFPNLQVLYESVIDEKKKKDYGDAGAARIYISLPKLE